MKNWNVSSAVRHDMAPAVFAERFARAKARRLGLNKWKVRKKVFSSKRNDGWRGYCGRAFMWRPGIGEIFVRLAPLLPAHIHIYCRFVGMPEFVLNGGAESIVYVFAHEFGHILGWPGDKAGEVACCRFGYEAVMAWRERENECPACLI